MPTSIAIADGHYLAAKALSDMIDKFDDYTVLYIAESGQDLLNKVRRHSIPDIVLVDLTIAKIDGFETAKQLRQQYPSVRVVALTMTDREENIIRMLQNGARAYLPKGCRPSELQQALNDVMVKGFYYSEFLTQQLLRSLNVLNPVGGHTAFGLKRREYDFLKMACSELTYNEIADRMCVSPRTVDGYREVVFQKMSVRTRVGMVMEAVRHGLVEL